ncbi:MAG: chemotaxis response regulator protein-glutamate methylesterase [Pseudomonadota bacterium]
MRIAIVNDLPLAVEALRRLIVEQQAHEVAWIAASGREAVESCRRDPPDLILMDMVMPDLNGAEATRIIMSETPCPILVVTSSVNENASLVFEAMGAGALDAVSTPVLGLSGQHAGKDDFIQKLRTIERLLKADRRKRKFAARGSGPGVQVMLAIGASTGGPHAVAEIIRHLPDDLPASVVVVQHIDESFAPGLIAWLGNQTKLKVKMAQEGETARAATVYVAATNNHLTLTDRQCFKYESEPKSLVYRPSVDVFFNSIAANWSGNVIGVLLTGMGRDGAQGLLQLKMAGALTIAQNKETCAVYGMPRAAVEIGAADHVLPLSAIAGLILARLQPCRIQPDRVTGYE